jgi:hypothetical protein
VIERRMRQPERVAAVDNSSAFGLNDVTAIQ